MEIYLEVPLKYEAVTVLASRSSVVAFWETVAMMEKVFVEKSRLL